jgi:hypothetical protein
MGKMSGVTVSHQLCLKGYYKKKTSIILIGEPHFILRQYQTNFMTMSRALCRHVIWLIRELYVN